MKAYTSAGAQKLAAISKRSGGFPTVAERLGCASAAPRHWASGRRTPSPEWRGKLCEAYGIPVPSWDEPAVLAASAPPSSAKKKSRAKAPDAAAPPALPAVPDAESTEALLSWAIGALKALQVQAENDPLALVSPRDQVALLGTLTTALHTRARLRGEDQPSKRKFMGSSWWRTIKEALGRGLRGHPVAAAAVARELDALEDAADVGAKGGQHV